MSERSYSFSVSGFGCLFALFNLFVMAPMAVWIITRSTDVHVLARGILIYWAVSAGAMVLAALARMRRRR